MAVFVHATSSAANTVCKNPDQYDGAVKIGDRSCDSYVQTLDSLNPLFAKRDCDPKKGVNSKTNEECTGGSDCGRINKVAPAAVSLRDCCKDNWDFCSENAPKAYNTVCQNPEQYNGTVTFLGSGKSCDETIKIYTGLYPLFDKRDCDPNKGWNSKTSQECTGGSDCSLGQVKALTKSLSISCCKDNWDVCSKNPPKPANTVCTKPDQYDGTATFLSTSCDAWILNLNNAYPMFEERDCDPKRGWNRTSGKECTGGSGCQLDWTATLMKQYLVNCCKDGWFACSKDAPKAPNTVCKNPDQYDGTAKTHPSGDQTCDAAVKQMGTNFPLFAKRDCDPNKGWNSRTRQECTGGSDCQLGHTKTLIAHLGLLCCKDKWDVCSDNAPKAPNTVCKNPDQYHGTAAIPQFGNQTCDFIMAFMDRSLSGNSVNSLFAQRDCDPNKGWNSVTNQECTGGSDCKVGEHVNMTKQIGTYCCKDKKDVCSKGPTTAPKTTTGAGPTTAPKTTTGADILTSGVLISVQATPFITLLATLLFSMK